MSELKTAEQWVEESFLPRSVDADPHTRRANLFRKIQENAVKHGMELAAELTKHNGLDTKTTVAILTLRDNYKLPEEGKP